MADVDIDPFSNHNKTDAHPDETGELFLSPQEEEELRENQLGNQNANKKHRSEEQVL